MKKITLLITALAIAIPAFCSPLEDETTKYSIYPSKYFKETKPAEDYIKNFLKNHINKENIALDSIVLRDLISTIKKHNLRRGLPLHRHITLKIDKLSDSGSKQLLDFVIKQAHMLTKDKNPQSNFSKESVKYLESVEKMINDKNVLPARKSVLKKVFHMKKPTEKTKVAPSFFNIMQFKINSTINWIKDKFKKWFTYPYKA